ncbi:hypothetical protein ASPVEDRAFT_889447 [Aspergillus versicolor CBS 583.65]|uniref:Uncharacterized protein n=1 Tax=Aspergillus versicolor CBS 583.65 TaxID=1036611 RepID=A0A1L9PNH7_ASPVE|nr:uncharacterized protein ASPVEDRAFT_889447 [Aspergillus versicolor CBS 583.65]OJJ02996.1 hypothetical protein ASPVEDRAFT_889447 [Aspergillus versicolor CBS 583.65]
MAQGQELLPSRPLATGCELRFFTETNTAEHLDSDSPPSQHYYTELTYDGDVNSKVFEIPLHWHKAGDEPIFIPRYHLHGLKCLPGVKMKIREWTIPGGRFKERFFRDAFEFGNPPPFLHIMRVSWDGDNYPSLPGNIKFLDQMFVLIFGGLAKLVMPAKTVARTGA